MTAGITDRPCGCAGHHCTLTREDPRHGTATGYGNSKCRCLDCINAWSAYSVKARHARRSRGLTVDDTRHGTDNGYTNYNCRCDECRAARAANRKVA